MGRPVPWMRCFDRVKDHSPLPGRLFELPRSVQEQARATYRLLQSDSSHPGLPFKKLEGEERIYSVRIGLGHRALGTMRGNRIVWFWIGSHADYDRKV